MLSPGLSAHGVAVQTFLGGAEPTRQITAGVGGQRTPPSLTDIVTTPQHPKERGDPQPGSGKTISGSILRPCSARCANGRRAVSASASDVWDRNDWSRRGSSEHGPSFTTKEVSSQMLKNVFTHSEDVRSRAQLLPEESDPPGRCSSFRMLLVSYTHPMWSSVSAFVLPPDTVSLTILLSVAVHFSRTFKRDRTCCIRKPIRDPQRLGSLRRMLGLAKLENLAAARTMVSDQTPFVFSEPYRP